MDLPTLSQLEPAETATKKEDENPTRLAPKRKADSMDGPLVTCPLDMKREQRSEGIPRQSTLLERHASPGSLYGLVRARRKQLWVPALAWTGDHMRCLSVVFRGSVSGQQRIGETNGAASDGPSGGEETSDREWTDANWLRATRQLSSCSFDVQKLAAEELLRTVGLVKAGRGEGRQSGEPGGVNGDRVELWIGGRCVDMMRTDGVFGKEWGWPYVTSINLEAVRQWRRGYVRKRHRGRRGQARQEGKKKAVEAMPPALGPEDPYVASVLIGKAQAQVAAWAKKANRPEQETERGAKTVFAFGLAESRARIAYLYRASILPRFLRNLERPGEDMATDEVVIEYETISLDTHEVEETARRLWLQVGIDKEIERRAARIEMSRSTDSMVHASYQ